MTFRANLKELSATDRDLQNENFKLKMQIYHMRRHWRLKRARAEEDRRESYATPKVDNFYEVDDDVTEDDQEKLGDVGFENDSEVIKALQDKLEEKENAISNLEEENKSLWEQQDDLNGHLKNKTLVIEKLKASHSSLKARAEGSRMQMDVAAAAMEEAQNEAQEARKKFEQANIQSKREQARTGKILQSFEKEKMLREAAETCLEEQRTEVGGLREKMNTILLERNNTRQQLGAEIERRELWEATRAVKGPREEFLAGESLPIERLLTRLNEKRTRFAGETEYDVNWRDDVNEFLKECMEALYVLEIEVDSKRRAFLSNDTNAPMGTSGIVST